MHIFGQKAAILMPSHGFGMRGGRKLLNLVHAGSSVAGSRVNMPVKYRHLSMCHLGAQR